MASAELIAQASSFVSEWPQCIQTSLIKGFVASDCGADISCICKNEIFGLLVIQGTRDDCSVPDAITTTNKITSLCPTLQESRKPNIIATIVITTVLALASVVMRIASRRAAGSKLWLDDYLILAAMVVSLGETANIAAMIHAGFGTHFLALNVDQQVAWLKGFFIFQFLYSWSMTLIKLSIVVFYHRIFGVIRSMRITIYAIAVLLLAWFVAQVTYVTLECQPLEKFWNYTIKTGLCHTKTTVAGYSINGTSLLLDVVIFVVAIPALWGLKRSLTSRLSIIAIFCIGGLVCIAGAVRLPILVKMKLEDLPWSSTYAIIWCQIETKIGIVSACLPSFPTLLHKFGKAFKSSPFISHLLTPFRSRSHKRENTSVSEDTLVPEKPPLNARTTSNGVPRSAGSPVIAHFNIADDQNADSEFLTREKTKDWYSVIMRNVSANARAEYVQSEESVEGVRRDESSAV